MSPVRHGKRLYKQMALEVAVRNPERYSEILKTFSQFRGLTLNDDGILKIFAQLYIDGVVSTKKLDATSSTASEIKDFIKNNISHNNEWGYPTGYQAGFTRYLKTLSEFGFIYAQYNEPLRLSEVADAVVNGTLSLSEAFALQSLRFWRKSPYRRVLNDFNFFKFIINVIRRRNEDGHRLSYPQFMLALFSNDSNIDSFIRLIEENQIGDSLDRTFDLVKTLYDQTDDEHGKVCKQSSAFNDYGNTVFRVLQLTGFITVDYQGVILLSINSNRIHLFDRLTSLIQDIPDSAKDNLEEYFQLLGGLPHNILQCIIDSRDSQKKSVDSYNTKLEHIVNAYRLDEQTLADYLQEVSNGENDRRAFWFMQVPLKFEFLLSLYLYVCYGDEYEYKPNYICDDAGIPYSHAPGNVGDIEVFSQGFYWLIEATLIRNKNKQINNETINLFRHIDSTYSSTKYMSLIAPCIHDDTKVLIKVATIVSMLEKKSLIFAKPYSTAEYISNMSNRRCLSDMQENTMGFVSGLGKMLSDMGETFKRIK